MIQTNQEIEELERGKGVITVVSGLPRSGTSMMMGMLQAGGRSVLSDGVREADVDNPKGYFEFEAVKGLHKGETDWLGLARDKAVKIVSPLLRFLPDIYQYQIVFMQRKMEEILESQRVMLAHRGEISDRYGDQKMAEVYENDLRQIELWMGNRQGVMALFVNYNSLLKDPRGSLSRVNSFLGDALDTDAMAAVVEPDLYRQRK